MSDKRTSTEPNKPNDEQTTEDSDAVFRQEDNAKRENFDSISDTTLQDIPTEILHRILVKAIAMEVKNMKLAKSVWKEKADMVISRLGSVCSQWSNVFATDFFRLELHRALDGIAQEKFRMERVQELFFDCSAFEIATLKDDMFLLCLHNDDDDEEISEISPVNNITVYDRNDLEVKSIIELPGLYDGKIVACNVSNCVYVLKEKFESQCASVFRITKDEDKKFNIQSWISDLSWPVDSISISDDGRIILSSTPDESTPDESTPDESTPDESTPDESTPDESTPDESTPDESTPDELTPDESTPDESTPDEMHVGLNPSIVVYYPNGFLHHTIIFPENVYGINCVDSRVIIKPNGNFVLASVYTQSEIHVNLTEIDPNGIIQRQYKSVVEPVNDMIFVSVVDAFGRLLIHDMDRGIEVLDSELNLLESTGPQSDNDDDVYFDGLHFSRERNEVMGIWSINSYASHLRIFRFIEE